ncbi:hypothetical protein BC829DRAFT_490574 [Chytridium lagenaria]|nr:hypothetical protein BC829DRAFT_490574 [Chytridium lagenaria]
MAFPGGIVSITVLPVTASRQLTRQPQIIILKDGTDTSQGRGQLLSNINACVAVADTIRTTLGPRGMDKLIVDGKGEVTISNDGATILRLLDIVHPAGKALVDISRAQDAEVGDGTTSVTLLAGELLKEVKQFIEEGVSPQVIVKGFRKASVLAVNKVKEMAVAIERKDVKEFRELLEKCAGTSMSSKIIHSQGDFFTKMVVDAVLYLDQEELNERMIGIKKVPGGAMQDSLFVDAAAQIFQKPSILSLNVELELKAEKDNAEVRIDAVQDYQAIVDAEWRIIYDKLEKIVATGAKVVLSRLPIGDLATQYFADRDIFCAGRVASEDISRVVKAVGGAVQTTVNDIKPHHLGTCEYFEEKQIGGESGEKFHDAIMIVRRAIKNKTIVAGGGATEMELSRYLRDYAKTIEGKQQMIVSAFAKALEVIPRQLCANAGFDATDILNKLRYRHAQEGGKWFGVDINAESITDNFDAFVWEPALVKTNMISSATEAACLILSVDETVKNAQSEQPGAQPMRGRGRGRGRR